MRELIINADDFGFTRDVNDGIVRAHREGVLTSTTLMANGAAFDHAVALAHATPRLDVGVHLVLVQGTSLLTGKPLPNSPAKLPLALLSLDLEAEMRAQIQKVIAAGIHPTHLDTHKHTHLIPQVFRTAARLAGEFGIPYLRLPLVAAPFFKRLARPYPVSFTQHLIGFRLTGSLTEQTFGQALANLPDGLSEFMCHPGLLTAELAAAPTRLKESRVRELEALISPRIHTLLNDSGVRLRGFSPPFQSPFR
ncbi:MAG TPA: ChbG/HpnK family deacetylase [Bryobacteraceae bacterium]|nr:ChbG/HpnK family deacetylase [Bryobacteraceae bacterium]